MVAMKLWAGLVCVAAATEIPLDGFDSTESLSLLQLRAGRSSDKSESRAMTLTKIHTNRRCQGQGTKKGKFDSPQACAEAFTGLGIKYLGYWKQTNDIKGLRGVCVGWTEAQCPENRISKVSKGVKNKFFRCTEEEEVEATGDPHMKNSAGAKEDLCCEGGVCHACSPQLIQKSTRGNVDCGFSADACKMECEKVGKTFGVASPRANGKAGWPGVGDYAGVGCYTYTPRMARFLGPDTANSCVYGIMDSGKHPESDAELASTHQAWARFGPGTGGRQLYVRLPNTFGNPHGVSHCEDLEEPTDPSPEDTESEEEAEQEAQQELEEEDQAAATGDPHMTTNTHDHFDLSSSDLSLLEP